MLTIKVVTAVDRCQAPRQDKKPYYWQFYCCIVSRQSCKVNSKPEQTNVYRVLHNQVRPIFPEIKWYLFYFIICLLCIQWIFIYTKMLIIQHLEQQCFQNWKLQSRHLALCLFCLQMQMKIYQDLTSKQCNRMMFYCQIFASAEVWTLHFSFTFWHLLYLWLYTLFFCDIW